MQRLFSHIPLMIASWQRSLLLSLLMMSTLALHAQTLRHINGHVTDEVGEALAGADIYTLDKSIGTIADADGHYAIDVPDVPSLTLEFNFIGMKPVRVKIGQRTVIDVVLETDAKVIDQVVVTGYQTLSRERSAGSFAKVEAADIADRAKAQGSLLKGLEGQTAGLSVTTTADGTQYLMRGVTSINSKTEPLFIVDGVPMPRDMVDKLVSSNDVEDITLLKDATAASIWGSQAANGVVVITTRDGSNSKGVGVTYNGSFTWRGKPDYSYQDMMTSEDFIRAARDVFDPSTYTWSLVSTSTYGAQTSWPVVFPHELPMYQYYRNEISLAERDAALAALAAQNGRADYERYMMSNDLQTNHAVAFSGKVDNNSYYASLEYEYTQGNSRNVDNNYKVYMRDVMELTPRAKLDLSLNASYATAKSHLTSGDDDGLDYLTHLPYAVFYDVDGNELSHTGYLMGAEQQQRVSGVSGIGLDYYPVSDYLQSMDKTSTGNVWANAGLTLKLPAGLSYEGRFQYAFSNSASEAYYPASTYKVRVERAYATDMDGVQYLPSSGGRFTTTAGSTRTYTVRNQLHLDNTFGADDVHRLTGVGGFEFSSNRYASNATMMRGYDMQTMQYIFYDDYFLAMTGVRNPVLPMMAGSATNEFEPNYYTQSDTEYRFVSFYTNMAYTLHDRYSLNASVRVDQSNLFGSDPSVQFKPIWSVGGVWNMEKEAFMAGVTAVDMLRPRLSFGYAGNSPNPGEGGPYNILSSVSDPRFSRFGLGYTVATPANEKLTWEKTRIVNVGIDFAVLADRLSGSLDFYDKYTTNLLAPTPVDPTTGFATVLTNIGELKNRGFELSLSSTNIHTRNFSWNTDLNFSLNRNRLVSMYVQPPGTPSSLVNYEYWEGYPTGTLFAYRWAGLDPATGVSRVYDSQGNIVSRVPDIDSIDAVPFMGTTIAPINSSLINTLSYKGFELSCMFIMNAGNVMRNDINTTYTGRLTGALHNDFALRWRHAGDETHTDVPVYFSMKNTAIDENDVVGLYRYADINVLDASYIKLRDVSLAWNMPHALCQRLKLQSVRLHGQVSNLFYIPFNSEGIDPESHSLAYGSRGEHFGPAFTLGTTIDF